MESRKMVLKWYLQGSYGETDVENRLMDVGRGKERVRCMERVTWKLTILLFTIFIINSKWEFAVWLRKLKQIESLYQSRGVGWRRKWEGGLKGKGYVYACG